MLTKLLDFTEVEKTSYAAILGVDPKIFSEWIVGSRSIPEIEREALASALGIKPEALLKDYSGAKEEDLAAVLPSIWYKLRSSEASSKDKEYTVLIRLLAHHINSFDRAQNDTGPTCDLLFATIQTKVDKQASAVEQGRAAARILRKELGLQNSKTGIGPLFRTYLRNKGMLIIECPITNSDVEGLCFYVGTGDGSRPTLFANSWGTTWFRRNFIVAHEVCHAIFDAAELDFRKGAEKGIAELRAQAFAQELLVPIEVLKHVSANINWRQLRAGDLAFLVSEIHVEDRAILKAAQDYALITDDEKTAYAELKTADALRTLSPHALSAAEFFKSSPPRDFIQPKSRVTTLTRPKLRLPVPFLQSVLEAWKQESISTGRAAQLLMIDDYDFRERFVEEPSED